MNLIRWRCSIGISAYKIMLFGLAVVALIVFQDMMTVPPIISPLRIPGSQSTLK